jgi:peptidyl-dipeptidase Dcp
MSVWKPAVEKVHQDVEEMQKIVDKEGGNFKIELGIIVTI